MRPFKFFFSISLGIIIFFFLAKFILLALIIAAVFSIAFHGFRRLKWFLQRRPWDEYDQPDHLSYENIPSAWGSKSSPKNDHSEWSTDYRTIIIE